MYLCVISTDSLIVSSCKPRDQWGRLTSSITLYYDEMVRLVEYCREQGKNWQTWGDRGQHVALRDKVTGSDSLDSISTNKLKSYTATPAAFCATQE